MIGGRASPRGYAGTRSRKNERVCWRADSRLDERELREVRRSLRNHVARVTQASAHADTVEQIAGELIGNVQRYAPGPFCVEAHWEGDSLRLTVHDAGPCFDVAQVGAADPEAWEAEHGRGIAIVKALGGSVEAHLGADGGCLVSVLLAMDARGDTEPTPCPNDHPGMRRAHCPRIRRFITGASRADVVRDRAERT